MKELDLSAARRLGEGDENRRNTEVAVVLRDLVLEHEVVPERVPRQLAQEPMILVQILPVMREDQMGSVGGLEGFEDVLYRFALRVSHKPGDVRRV